MLQKANCGPQGQLEHPQFHISHMKGEVLYDSGGQTKTERRKMQAGQGSGVGKCNAFSKEPTLIDYKVTHA